MLWFDIVFYIVNMMNGWKLLIFLYEVEIDYELVNVDFLRKEQYVFDYVKMNLNGKILIIWDWMEGCVIFESGVILWYLFEKYGWFLFFDFVEWLEIL